jgi:hypothetical protein
MAEENKPFSNYVPMGSYKDARDKDTICWGDLHFFQLERMLKARGSGSRSEYESSVEATEMSLLGFADEKFEQDMRRLDLQREKIELEQGYTAGRVLYYDEKGKILCSLAARVRVTKPRLIQYIGQDSIAQEIAYKLINGFGQNLFITGKTGSGKSYTSIRLAQEVTKMSYIASNQNAIFDVNRHVVFTPIEFIRLYNDEEACPEGSCIIFDEAGVTFSSRDALTKANKLFSKLMQIIRHRRILVIFTAPDLSFIDKSARKMLHWWFETASIDKALKRCHVKPHAVEINQMSGDVLMPYPVIGDRQVGEVVFDLVDKDTAKQYEWLAKKYKDAVAADTEKGLSQPSDEELRDGQYKGYYELRVAGKSSTEAKDILGITPQKSTRFNRMYKNQIATEKARKYLEEEGDVAELS